MVKIKFVDFWKNFDPEDNYFIHFFRKHFDVKLSDDPDLVIFSVYGYAHLNYQDRITLCFTGENVLPDFNRADYALGFHHLEFPNRYLRFPLYVIYPGFERLPFTSPELDSGKLSDRKFCNFVYSNASNADPTRTDFFKRLARYKKVDAGGMHLNNLGYRVKDKQAFIKNYKFTIAFENSSSPGYTTEKLMEPMVANSLPIYYGNPLVNHDFNAESFIWMKDHREVDRVIEEIISLDQSEDLYLEKLRQPWLTPDQAAVNWEARLVDFVRPIVTNPVKQNPGHGFLVHQNETLDCMHELYKKRMRLNQKKRLIKKMISFGKY
ncbi:glycosyltransferase family 10 domain-containing protein [Cyclobacterium xiamenense]|uniref:glycosyltransferase family 10 domain-containing protein n=1 Tax=Cyclobacterium xiamenense TaxID=1297121 RepID=UPI0012B72AE3|nr:glycosyltransferase family 10 [Cyclobacterium xiamenense]